MKKAQTFPALLKPAPHFSVMILSVFIFFQSDFLLRITEFHLSLSQFKKEGHTPGRWTNNHLQSLLKYILIHFSMLLFWKTRVEN